MVVQVKKKTHKRTKTSQTFATMYQVAAIQGIGKVFLVSATMLSSFFVFY